MVNHCMKIKSDGFRQRYNFNNINSPLPALKSSDEGLMFANLFSKFRLRQSCSDTGLGQETHQLDLPRRTQSFFHWLPHLALTGTPSTVQLSVSKK